MMKKTLMAVLLAVVVATCGYGMQAPSSDVYASAQSTNRTDATLNALITALGTRVCRVVIDQGDWTIANNVTFPSTVVVWVCDGSRFNISAGKTVTFNGGLEAGRYAIFTGAGTTAGAPLMEYRYSEWGSVTGYPLGLGVVNSITNGMPQFPDVTNVVTSYSYQTAPAVTSIITSYGYVTAAAATNAATGNGYITAGTATNIVTSYGYTTPAVATNIVTSYAYQNSLGVTNIVNAMTTSLAQAASVVAATNNYSSIAVNFSNGVQVKSRYPLVMQNATTQYSSEFGVGTNLQAITYATAYSVAPRVFLTVQGTLPAACSASGGDVNGFTILGPGNGTNIAWFAVGQK
jgi:hypothetical protein